jgi:hypothetical protein
MNAARKDRIGKNEILLREVNVRIEEIGAPTNDQQRIGFVCECGDVGCMEQVQLERSCVTSATKWSTRTKANQPNSQSTPIPVRNTHTRTLTVRE